MSKRTRVFESKSNKSNHFSNYLYECNPPNTFFNIMSKECHPIELNKENLTRIDKTVWRYEDECEEKCIARKKIIPRALIAEITKDLDYRDFKNFTKALKQTLKLRPEVEAKYPLDFRDWKIEEKKRDELKSRIDESVEFLTNTLYLSSDFSLEIIKRLTEDVQNPRVSEEDIAPLIENIYDVFLNVTRAIPRGNLRSSIIDALSQLVNTIKRRNWKFDAAYLRLVDLSSLDEQFLSTVLGLIDLDTLNFPLIGDFLRAPGILYDFVLNLDHFPLENLKKFLSLPLGQLVNVDSLEFRHQVWADCISIQRILTVFTALIQKTISAKFYALQEQEIKEIVPYLEDYVSTCTNREYLRMNLMKERAQEDEESSVGGENDEYDNGENFKTGFYN